jgi:uncharacterized protein YbdZ (MbtH family)
MSRIWVEISGRVLFTLPNSQYRLWNTDGEIPHPWDMDCIAEQLLAIEAGLA